jgi:hypothetical protein
MWFPRGRLNLMRRALILVIAIVAAGWARAVAAQSGMFDVTGESWLPETSTMLPPAATSAEVQHEGRAIGTQWPSAIQGPPFGSGLEEGAPSRTPNVFLQSGLEGLTTARTIHARSSAWRFGSGLEDDAPTRDPSVFLQSGLEGLSANTPVRHPRIARFGSGL